MHGHHRQARDSYDRAAANADGVFRDENLDVLSHLLDDFIRIPGTPIRFGLDGIVGFIPGIGDVVGGLASSIIIIAAWIRGVPKVTVARMVMNVAIETAVGSLPVVGNLFDIAWRANRRNYALLTGSLDRAGKTYKAKLDIHWVRLRGAARVDAAAHASLCLVTGPHGDVGAVRREVMLLRRPPSALV